MIGPGSTHACDPYSVLRTGAALCSLALATAERMTFSTNTAARFLLNFSIEIASSTSRPRTRSITSRAFRGAMRANRCLDSNDIVFRPIQPPVTDRGLTYANSPLSRRRRRRARAGLGGLATGMAAEHAGRAELAELVPDHVLLHEHAEELVAVVHLEGVPDELRRDRA